MARAGLAQDERFQRHLTGPGHPERPERLAAIAEALEKRELADACTPIEVTPVDMEQVHRIHNVSYVDRFMRACETGQPYIDVPDSAISPETFWIAKLAAGTAINAVDDVMAGKIDNAFCALRPPGHHAEHDRSMGFCMFNNIALAARRLLDHHGLSRVLILDWDVHHGNGTQHTFETTPQVLFISLHGHPTVVYPGTGYETERGIGEGAGHTLNLPMMPHSGDDDYRRAFDDKVLPEIERYAPQFVLVDAGFDAHRADPLAPLDLETESYGWMTDTMVDVARRHCRGRLVSFLEGGYNLKALADSVALHVERLLEGAVTADPQP
jgi:acetoin utilization deacetylase AcuC-like enzyme